MWYSALLYNIKLLIINDLGAPPARKSLNDNNLRIQKIFKLSV